MSVATVEYAINAPTDALEVIARFAKALPRRVEPERDLSRRFYDTFDWRLFRAGIGLECREAEPMTEDPPASDHLTPSADSPFVPTPLSTQPQFYWHDLQTGTSELLRQSGLTELGLLQDMPAGPLRERLAPLVEMRRLLPMVALSSHQIRLRLLNDDAKTLVWLSIELARLRELTSVSDGVAPIGRSLTSRLQLQGVRGYAEAFADARRLIEDRVGLEPAAESLLVEALQAAGHRPGFYSTKLDYRLVPDQRADMAARAILLRLLETIEANVAGVRQNLDSEFLHDLRIATRRTRSALSQVKDVFPPEAVEDFKARFAWLQRVTGPMRDLDVYLLDYPMLEQRLPVSMHGDLQPMRQLLTDRYEVVHAELIEVLDSEPFRALLRDWRAFLEPTVERLIETEREQSPKWATQPIKRLADRRIVRLLARVRREGRAISDASPPEQLHLLRKTCKKLRYVMEFFYSLYPARPMRAQLKQLKRLLDNLGRFQDTEVQVEHLREIAASVDSSGARLPTGTLLAMGVLMGQLLDEQARARAAFREVFDGFDSDANAKDFEALLATGTTEGADERVG